MNSIDCLVDIATNMGVLDKDVIVKVYGDDCNTFAVAANGKFDRVAMNAAHLNGCEAAGLASVIGYFKSHHPISELKNTTIGLGRTKVLVGDAEFHKNGNRDFVYENGKLIEIHFGDGEDCQSWYRLTSSAMVNELVKVPQFIGNTCDVSFVPSITAINLFKKNVVEAFNNSITHFWPMMTSRGYLFFSFDRDAPSNKTDRFEMARGLPYMDIPPHSYNASAVNKVLKLVANAKSYSIGISVLGYMQIDVESQFGSYRFIILGSDHKIWQWDWATKWPAVWNVEARIHDDLCMHVDWEPEL